MPHCLNCGEFVTHSFARVFGDNGQVASCMHCNETRDMSNGKGMPETTDEQA
jgi:hypothetical protein